MLRKLPFLLTLISVIGGIAISIGFGINEDYFKDRIKQGLEKNVKVQAITDEAKKAETIKTEIEKNWRYYLRYHFHAGAIAALTLALLVFLSFLETSPREHLTVSYMLALGGWLYPFVWLFAALYGPEMGRNEAKESFRFLGYMGGVYLLGLIYTLFLASARKWKAPLA